MAPKKTTTPMTNAQLKALITQGVADALAEIEANRSRNGDDSHYSKIGIRRQTHVARESRDGRLASRVHTALHDFGTDVRRCSEEFDQVEDMLGGLPT
ncbi:hypothetical protein Tco_1507684 [Tanacetum coccineum]